MNHQQMLFYTHGGVVAPPDAPSIESVARSLFRESRYCGNSSVWWNVGLHSLLVSDLLPEPIKLYGLLHDAPECLTGDIPHDLKTKKQRMFEDVLLERFYHRWGIKPPSVAEQKQVKEADYLAVHGEVWVGAGPDCLRPLYERAEPIEQLTRHYLGLYSYADCLEFEGQAVQEFLRRFELYKTLLKR